LVEIRTLRGFQIVLSGEQGKRHLNERDDLSRIMLYLLLVESYGMPSKEMAALFKGVLGERSVYNGISEARIAKFGPLISPVIVKGYIEISDEARIGLDSERFFQLAQKAFRKEDDDDRLNAAYEALSLYAGPFIPDDIYVRFAPDDIQKRESMYRKVVDERRRLASTYASMIIDMVSILRQRGNRAEADRILTHGISLHEQVNKLHDICDDLRDVLVGQNSSSAEILRSEFAARLRKRIGSHRIVILRGEHKVGKTWLIENALPLTGVRRPILHRIKSRESSIQSFLRFVHNVIDEPLLTESDIDTELIDHCFNILEAKQSIIVIENAENLQPALWAHSSVRDNPWQYLAELIRQDSEECCLLVTVTLSRPLQPIAYEECPEEGIVELILPGLTPQEGAVLLATLGMSDMPQPEREELSRRFHGNPGLLKWASDHRNQYVRQAWPYQPSEIQQEAEQVLHVLLAEQEQRGQAAGLIRPQEKFLLLCLSLIRIPVPAMFLALIGAILGVDVQHIVDDGYLLNNEDGYLLQNEFRYYVLAHSKDTELEDAHRFICELYQKRLSEGLTILPRRTVCEAELLYHLLCLGDISHAAELIAHSKLVTSHNTAALVLQLRDILYAAVYLDDPDLSNYERAVLAFALGTVTRKAMVARKEFYKPDDLWYYQYAWKTITNAQLTELIPRVGYRYACALMFSGNLTTAREIMEKTLSVTIARKKLKMANYMYSGLADIALWDNDCARAEAALDQCFALMNDDPVQRELYTPATLHAQARLWYMQGNMHEAFLNEMRAARHVMHQNRMLHRLTWYFSFAAAICFRLGRLRSAQRLLDQAEYHLRNEYSQRESLFHLRRAQLAALRGQWDSAQDHTEQVGIYYDAVDHDPFQDQLLDQVATEIRKAKAWEKRFMPARLKLAPIDYPYYQKLAEYLPLDVPWVLGVARPTHDVRGSSSFARSRRLEQERFLREEIDEPGLIHPRLLDLPIEDMRADLLEQRKHVQEAFNPIVRRLYTEIIDEGQKKLELLALARRGDGERVQHIAIELYGSPQQDRLRATLGSVFASAKDALATKCLPI